MSSFRQSLAWNEGRTMRFKLTASAEAFRDEIGDYFKIALPPGWLDRTGQAVFDEDDFWELYRATANKLGTKGWLALDWPKEYGGQERNHEEVTVFRVKFTALKREVLF